MRLRRAARPASGRRRWIAGLLLLPGLLGLLAYTLADTAPVAAFETARQALGQARATEAERYAPEPWQQAQARWQEALRHWQQENRRWFILRNYDAARQAAGEAARLGEAATRRARHARDSLAWHATLTLALLRDQLDSLQAGLSRLSHRPRWQTTLATAHARLVRGEAALERKDFLAAAEAAEAAQAVVQQVGQALEQTVTQYLARLPLWRRWHDDTVAWSARHRAPAIVVDKMAHRLYLYEAGRLRHTFDAELGPNWMGPKRHEGDLSTPEGQYRVVRKRGAGETIYHRALDLDYPNAADRQRFLEARRRGTLPPHARIGGNIEIHGEGGRGADWTRGCIALANADMERLFELVPTGTPVTIVGALEVPAFARIGAPPPGHFPAAGRPSAGNLP
ncbi:MAG: hypothetical protein KatS3mg044_1147 [Rhodothermaceae bacterium]|nr:MAG: hypothetical protein KatS3mg044_1147 [Rhodothermaceae bacterium]